MIKVGKTVYVKYVNQRYTKSNSPYTTFSISDKVKDTDGQYMYYTVTVWNKHLNIKDGDKVTLTHIDSVASRMYNGKVKYDIVAEAEEGEVEPMIQTNSNYAPQDKMSVPSADDAFLLADDTTSLPFDL